MRFFLRSLYLNLLFGTPIEISWYETASCGFGKEIKVKQFNDGGLSHDTSKIIRKVLSNSSLILR
jgi:hypothetical protein